MVPQDCNVQCMTSRHIGFSTSAYFTLLSWTYILFSLAQNYGVAVELAFQLALLHKHWPLPRLAYPFYMFFPLADFMSHLKKLYLPWMCRTIVVWASILCKQGKFDNLYIRPIRNSLTFPIPACWTESLKDVERLFKVCHQHVLDKLISFILAGRRQTNFSWL